MIIQIFRTRVTITWVFRIVGCWMFQVLGIYLKKLILNLFFLMSTLHLILTRILNSPALVSKIRITQMICHFLEIIQFTVSCKTKGLVWWTKFPYLHRVHLHFCLKVLICSNRMKFILNNYRKKSCLVLLHLSRERIPQLRIFFLCLVIVISW